MKRDGLYVLVQAPPRDGGHALATFEWGSSAVYIRCADIDECLEVVEAERADSPAGTRLTMLQAVPGKPARLLALWRVTDDGVQRYLMNPVVLKDYGDYCRLVSQLYDEAPEFEEAEAWRWKKLIAHVERFYQRILSKVDVRFVAGQPYDTAREMRRRVRSTGTLLISKDFNEHPIFTPTQNLKFRAVHDYVVHILPGPKGPDFSQRGEMRAYNLHRHLAPKDTWPALFTEVAAQACYHSTRGVFPVQKIAVLPLDFYDVGAELL